MATLVIDASLLVEVILREPVGRAAAASTLRDARLVAPAHLDAEVLSALIGLLRGGALDEDRVRVALRRLARAPIERAPLGPLLREAYGLRHNLSGYDALYVALARHRQCGLITTDRRLAAAPGLGVPVTMVG